MHYGRVYVLRVLNARVYQQTRAQETCEKVKQTHERLLIQKSL